MSQGAANIARKVQRKVYEMVLQAHMSEALDRAARVALEYVQGINAAQTIEKLCYWSGRSVVDLYAQLALDLDVTWRAPLPPGPKIVAANHPTTTDPFYLLSVVPERMCILITDMAFEVPGFGRYLRVAGHVPVVEGRGWEAFEQAKQRLISGQTIGIFPEGALSPLKGDLGFHSARTGAVRLALSTGVPIIPVGISLDPKRVRFSNVDIGDRREIARWYIGGPYAVTAGEAMYCDGNVEDWEHVRSLSQRVMQRIVWLSHASEKRLHHSRLENDGTPGLFRRRGAAESM